MKLDIAVQEVELQDAAEDTVSEAEEDRDDNSGKNQAFSVTLAALRFVTRLASGIFSRGQKNSEPAILDSRGEAEFQHQDMIEIAEGRYSSNASSSQKSSVVDDCGIDSDQLKGEENMVPGSTKMLDSTETSEKFKTEKEDASENNKVDNCNFKRFDISKDPSDHYFLGANGQVIFSSPFSLQDFDLG